MTGSEMPNDENRRLRARIDDLESRGLSIRAIANDDEVSIEDLRTQADGLVATARGLRDLLGVNQPGWEGPAKHDPAQAGD